MRLAELTWDRITRPCGAARLHLRTPLMKSIMLPPAGRFHGSFFNLEGKSLIRDSWQSSRTGCARLFITKTQFTSVRLSNAYIWGQNYILNGDTFPTSRTSFAPRACWSWYSSKLNLRVKMEGKFRPFLRRQRRDLSAILCRAVWKIID